MQDWDFTLLIHPMLEVMTRHKYGTLVTLHISAQSDPVLLLIVTVVVVVVVVFTLKTVLTSIQ